MKVYRIKDWEDAFERSDLGKTKKWSWVAMPLKHSGKGFRRVCRQPNPIELWGAFELAVEVAASLPIRGTLLDRDGPVNAIELADKTGMPSVHAFQRVLDEMVVGHESRIDWIEVIEVPDDVILKSPFRDGSANARPDAPEDIRTPPDASGLPNRTEPDTTEPNQTKPNDVVAASLAALFDAEKYPADDPIRAHPNATFEQVSIAVENANAKKGLRNRRAWIATAVREKHPLSEAARKLRDTKERRKAEAEQRKADALITTLNHDDQPMAEAWVRDLDEPDRTRFVEAVLNAYPALRQMSRKDDPMESPVVVAAMYQMHLKSKGLGHVA